MGHSGLTRGFLRLRSIQFENFRNHRSFSFEPEDGINLIYGQNGSGKTSILEGIHYCALTKGFVSAADGECLSFSAGYFLLTALFESSSGIETAVRLSYTKESGKKLQIDGNELKPFSLHIGSIPCISFSPLKLLLSAVLPEKGDGFLIMPSVNRTDGILTIFSSIDACCSRETHCFSSFRKAPEKTAPCCSSGVKILLLQQHR